MQMQTTDGKEKYDFIFKLVIIGNANCGKSSILHYFVNNKVKKNTAQTVGVEFASKMINIRGKNIKLQLWDTAGQERYRSVARTYYRGTLGALVVYDVTNTESYNALSQWIKDAREFGRSDIGIVVCANKIDLKKDRLISTEQGVSKCKEEQVTQFECSAYTGENVEQVFASLTEILLTKIDQGQIEQDDLKPRFLNPATRNQKISKDSDPQLKDKQQSQCGYC